MWRVFDLTPVVLSQSLRRSLHGAHRYHSHSLSMADCPSFAHEPLFDAQGIRRGPGIVARGLVAGTAHRVEREGREPGQQNNSPRFRLFRANEDKLLGLRSILERSTQPSPHLVCVALPYHD